MSSDDGGNCCENAAFSELNYAKVWNFKRELSAAKRNFNFFRANNIEESKFPHSNERSFKKGFKRDVGRNYFPIKLALGCSVRPSKKSQNEFANYTKVKKRRIFNVKN